MACYKSIVIALMLSASGFTLACTDSMKSGNGQKSSGPAHNIGVYQYHSSTNELVLVDSWHDPDIDYMAGFDDYIYSEPGWSNFILFTTSAPASSPPDGGGTPPGGGGSPPGGGGGDDLKSVYKNEKERRFDTAKCIDDADDVKDFGTITVSGVGGGLGNWLGGAATAWAIIGAYAGGGGGGGGVTLPPLPPEPPDCNTGDPEIDDTADLREELMDSSLLDPDNPIETGGLFWPNGDGGYDLLEFGIDIPRSTSDACSISPSEFSSDYPPADEWPEGVILFHVQPYSPFEPVPQCGGTYRFGPSPGDRNSLKAFRSTFRDDIQGMVMDKHSIYKFGETRSEDGGRTQRCK